jgi:hypothetical protein
MRQRPLPVQVHALEASYETAILALTEVQTQKSLQNTVQSRYGATV